MAIMEEGVMSMSRSRSAAQQRSSPNVPSVPVPGWIDLIGDPDGSSDGLVVTLAFEPRERGGQGEAGLPPSMAATAVQVALVDGRGETIRRLSTAVHAVAAVVIDSGIRPPHADHDRETRRAECLDAARTLGKQSLRDVDATLWRRWHDELPTVLFRRATHVRGENDRALAMAAAIEREDWPSVGHLMMESQRSLLCNFEVCCPEVDALIASAAGVDGVYGCRRAGGGFSGQVVAVVEACRAHAIVTEIIAAYRSATGRLPNWCVAAVASDHTVQA